MPFSLLDDVNLKHVWVFAIDKTQATEHAVTDERFLKFIGNQIPLNTFEKRRKKEQDVKR